MLSSKLQKTIQTAYKDIAQGIPGFVSRPQQRELIGKTATAMAQGDILVAEAPTGSGKSLAYCLSAIPVAKAKKTPLIISTATTALQNQLIDDMELITKHTELRFSWQIAKGRGQYICIRDLNALLTRTHEFSLFIDSRDYKSAEKLHQALKDGWSGDKDELDFGLDENSWQWVQGKQSTCSKRFCPHIQQCPYYVKRDSLEKADVIIANHALVFTDANMELGTLLPSAEPYLIVDECHHIKSIFRDQNTHMASTRQAAKSLARLHKLDTELKAFDAQLFGELKTTVLGAVEHSKALSDKLNGLARNIDSSTLILELKQGQTQFEDGRLPEFIQQISNEILECSTLLHKALNTLQGGVDKAYAGSKLGPKQTPKLEQLVRHIGMGLTLCEQQQQTWQLASLENVPKAVWMEQSEQSPHDYSFFVCQLFPGYELKNKLWDKVKGMLCTSATIQVFNKFDTFLHETGLGLVPEVQTLALDSPFDYRRANLYIPTHIANPKDDLSHTQDIIDYLNKIPAKGEAVLVLFNSKRKLNQVEQGFKLKKQLIVQGQYSRGEIIKRHKKQIDKGASSVIFGLQSFGEGVDIKGKYLTSLVITQLPFTHVDDPVTQAENRYYERQNKSGFALVQLPKAALKLTQWTGRLLRSEQDWGSVHILDPRLISSRYGKQLLDGLPPFNY